MRLPTETAPILGLAGYLAVVYGLLLLGDQDKRKRRRGALLSTAGLLLLGAANSLSGVFPVE